MTGHGKRKMGLSHFIRQSIGTNPQIIQIFKLADKDFKAKVIKAYSGLKRKNGHKDEMDEKISKEVEIFLNLRS